MDFESGGDVGVQRKMVAVVGGGLAGCECAMRLARSGIETVLYEMRPGVMTPAHESGELAELVCSNSLRSNELESGVGLLKEEMRALHSLVMDMADAHRVPAGKALAVDRRLFSQAMTRAIEKEPRIRLERREICSLDDPAFSEVDAVVIAAGPLASSALSRSLAEAVGKESLYFYDAIAPIVSAESIDMSRAFWGSRYRPDEDDYLNCPMSEDEYRAFYTALRAGETVPARDFEKERHFEGCMPIEALAERGEHTLTFGPFKPVGFVDPTTERRPFAVVQLRAENRDKTAFNLVGCQTKLKYGEQDRIFRLIPALHEAEFLRYGSMHRNTYVDAPVCLDDDLSLKSRPGVYLAGQITGVEGYVESAACGLWVGLLLAAKLWGTTLPCLPPETALGALIGHLRTPTKDFQPSNVNFGLMPELGTRLKKKERKSFYARRAQAAFAQWLQTAAAHCPLLGAD